MSYADYSDLSGLGACSGCPSAGMGCSPGLSGPICPSDDVTCVPLAGLGCAGCSGCPSDGLGCAGAGAGCAGCAGLGCGCPTGQSLSGLGQAAGGPVTSIMSLIDSIVKTGVSFIPETKEMRERREQETALEQIRLKAEEIRASATTKTVLIGGAVLVGGVLVLKVLFGKKKRRR